MLRQFLGLVALLSLVNGLAANELSVDAVNSAEPSAKSRGAKGLDPLIVKTQVLLDRAHFSPGEIDGKQGENLQKAVRAYGAAQAIASDGRLTDELWGKLSASSRDPVLQEYAISAADLKGPFTERLPSKLEEMKDLPALGYRSVREAIAEKFHMSEELLTALNPGKKFDAAGETVIVANVSNKISGKGARIEVDKTAETLKVFDGAGRLLAVYPATVGSEEKPAPDGALRITSISRNPVYRYDPEYKFKGVKSQEFFHHSAGTQQPRRHGLDRALAEGLRNSRNATSGKSQQDRVERMRPADELGCRAGGEPDAKRIAGGVCGRRGGIERCRAEEGGVAEPQALGPP